MIKAILTIDDLPQNNTVAIIDYLKSMNIKPVFFTVGELLEKNPQPVIYALQNGIVVGNHTYTHCNMGEITYEEGIEEIKRCEELLDDVYRRAGVKREVKLFRFPYLDTGRDNSLRFLKYLEDNGFQKIDDSDVKDTQYIQHGWNREDHVGCSFDCEEYLLRPDNSMTFDKILSKIDREFGNQENKPDQTHIILTHSHDETEEAEPLYYKKIVERMLMHGTRFIDPVFSWK